jgi:hypothetical protein
MKQRALKFSVRAALCIVLCLAQGGALIAAGPQPVATPPAAPAAEASPAVQDTPPPLGNETPATTPAVAPAATPKPHKKPKASGTPKPPKEIPFPLPIGEKASDAKLPEHGLAGELLSQLNAAQMTRLDNDHVQMHEVKIDLYHPDGKDDFHIVMPTSTFNLTTHIITSNEPVTVKTADFELTGERMEFNTVDRTGKLLGHVSMHIHNLKQVAAVPDATPNPQ